MTKMTAEEAHIAARELEQAAAAILGRMLFEFSRLDVALGMLLVWADEGRQLEELTNKVVGYTFHKKLDFLAELVDEKFKKGSNPHIMYSQWLAKAHSARTIRNQLVHGRWCVNAYQQQIINVIGLPASLDQREVGYSLGTLEDVLSDISYLQVELQKQRKQWPV